MLLINEVRIIERLNLLSQFGQNNGGGIDRAFGSEADIEARNWLKNLWENELNFKVKIDSIANMWARVDGNEKLPAIVLGSHHDTVASGGKYDGAMGIILATEILQVIKENNYKLRHPLELVSFTAEEPNKFNLSTLGSRVASGKLELSSISEVEGLKEAIKKAGGDLEKTENVKISAGAMSSFIECHIEQGRRLFDKKLSLAVVPKVTGIYREMIKVVGETNHAGTTIMEHRHDALMAASELCLGFEKIVKEIHKDDVVGTVGKLEVNPNSVNIIPGEINLVMEFRTPNFSDAEIIYKKINECILEIENERGVKIIANTMLKQIEVLMDRFIVDTLNTALEELKEPKVELVSMAGHDAVHMSSITKTAMLFVSSVNGKSHCADEYTKDEDVIKAANALLKAVLILDKELD
ncbi:M20 family metallo-hydrolase [Clostridium acidisoli]|nr:M20 family metallo-hydrolase [Clostridium acidisoli]